MRYFLDAEFNGFSGDLISIALVPEHENAPPFYEVLSCTSPLSWAADKVLPVLGKQPISRPEICCKLRSYLTAASEPVVVASWPEDIAHLALLMLPARGRRLELPRLRLELLDLPLFDSEALSHTPHNACADATALRNYVLALEGGPRQRRPESRARNQGGVDGSK